MQYTSDHTPKRHRMSNTLRIGLNALLVGGVVGFTLSTLWSVGVIITYAWIYEAALATSLWAGFKLWATATFISFVLIVTSIVGLAKLEQN